MPDNGAVIKTIVYYRNGKKHMLKDYNVEFIEYLTGFKYIGEKMKDLKKLIVINSYLDLKKAMVV